MKLSIWKCHSFLFTQYCHDPKPIIIINDTVLSHGSTPQHTSLKLPGVHLDSQLTMKFHFQYLKHQRTTRLHQLSRVSNCIYGLDQTDLHTMYIAYIHSILEYASPAWSPCMSKTNLAALQWIQNQASCIILGVQLSTCLDALHYEASIPPLHTRSHFATALCAEKYRRHPLNDPLYQIAHQTLPPSHLKQSSWQYQSDTIWRSIGFSSAWNDDHTPCLVSLTSLSPRKPISFLPDIAPWDLQPPSLTITPFIPNLHKCDPPTLCHSWTVTILSQLPHFDYSFWTDGSLLENGQASSILLGFMSDTHPTKCRQLSLIALAQGPLRDYTHSSCTNIMWSSTYQSFLFETTNKYHCSFSYPWHTWSCWHSTQWDCWSTCQIICNLLHPVSTIYS